MNRLALRLGLLAALLVGCSADATLTVDLRTGLTPGVEFTEVVTHVSRNLPGAERDRLLRDFELVVDAELGDPRFLEGARIAELEGLEPGEYWIEVILRAPDGRELVSQILGPVEVVDVTGRTVVITRDCQGVECPGSGPPGNLACLQGRCVDPRCSPEEPEFCPPVSCEQDDDCTPPGVTCADTRCIASTCFVFAPGDTCPAESSCDADVGCVPDEMIVPPTAECSSPVCPVGNECALGRLSCDEERVCEPFGTAFAESPCERGLCDGAGACIGLPLEVEVVGGGVVVSEPSGLECEAATCVERFDRGTSVTLVAVEPEGLRHTGWEGDCASTDGRRCFVEMDGARSVRALFEGVTHQVLVVTSGTGRGAVAGGPIDCGSSCTAEVAHGASITLTATPAGPTDGFAGWGGACAFEASEVCTVTVTEDVVIGASFIDPPGDILQVVREGTGGGYVGSAPAGIDCGSVCAVGWAAGTDVTLEATPDATSTFEGWTGAGTACGAATTCMVTLGPGTTLVRARFRRIRYPVTVEIVGPGDGEVTSSAHGIACPGTCAVEVDAGTRVALLPRAAAGSEFDHWELATMECGLATACEFDVDGPRTVRAHFRRAPVRLTVTRTGMGSGRVEDERSPRRVDCGADCAETFTPPQRFELTATPDAPGSVFAGWSGGGCAGSGNPCIVDVAADATVTARFDRALRDLTVAVDGSGAGRVVSDPAGAIDCGSNCTETYPHGATVTLEAQPTGGSFFAGWSGACSSAGLNPRCTFTMTATTSVRATFSASTHTLSVSRLGTGDGTVTEIAPGSSIDCGGTCSASYTAGTDVDLVAVAAMCSDFVGWGAPCSGVGACQVTVSGPSSVSATFDQRQYTLTLSLSGGVAVRSRVGDAGAISCPDPGPCEERYDCGTTALLEARCPEGYAFDGWSLPSCGSSTSCDVPMNADVTVSASCSVREHRLEVYVTGSARGAVRSSPAGISCATGMSGTCTAGYAAGTSVTLLATPESDTECFDGWSLAPGCGSDPTCVIAMDMDQRAEARFEPCRPLMCTVEVNIEGTGSVSSMPLGIRCPGDCSETFRCGERVLLVADPPDGFDGWAGDCVPVSGRPWECSIASVASAGHSVTARFRVPQ